MDPANVSEELINDIWVRQTDIAKAKILADICTYRKLNYYCRLKQDHKFELYLNCVKKNTYRQYISKLRLVSHDLNVEMYRRTRNTSLLEKCPCCNEEKVEDEFHFLLECKCYNFIRKIYLPDWEISLYYFENILSSDDSMVMNNLGKIYFAFKERELILSST